MRHWILFFHLLSVIVWLGGSIYVEALMAAAGRGDDQRTLTTVFQKVGATNRRLFNLAGVAAIVFGFWLVVITSFEFEMLWVTVGILLATIAVVIDLFYATPRVDRAERALNAPVGESEGIADLMKQVTIASHARTGLLFLAMIFMVFKF